MKIVVFSDSHGIYNNMIEIVKNEKPDMIIHCGDYQRDASVLEDEFPDIPVHSVVGNCDYGWRGDEENIFGVKGKVFYITHGHLYGVKRGYMKLIYAGMEKCADVVICGHTHIPMYEEFDGMYIINPGSITYGEKTYGVIDIDENSFDYELKSFKL